MRIKFIVELSLYFNMKVRVVFVLLLLGLGILFGCKKSSPVTKELELVAWQDSFQHIMDSLHHINTAHYQDSIVYVNSQHYKDSLQIVSLEPTLVGMYLVSGNYSWSIGQFSSGGSILTNDTLIVTMHGHAFVVVSFRDTAISFATQPLAADTGIGLLHPDPTLNYDLYYNGPGSDPLSAETDYLSFPKNNTEHIDFSQICDNGRHSSVYLSGIKIH